jgi:queuine tRNA-ribosyltransferase
LRPGSGRIARFGGLHRFAGWNGAMLTDSGGFQVFSLKELRTISEEGVRFRAPTDGSYHLFTPESVMRVQHELGATSSWPLMSARPTRLRGSMPMTAWNARTAGQSVVWPNMKRWAAAQAAITCLASCRAARTRTLRARSAAFIASLPFPGIAIGGVSVGEPTIEMRRVVDATLPLLPADRPRYLMGVGTPDDILDAVVSGVDMFDCVLPTRMGRTGTLFTSRGRVNISNARWADEQGPVDPNCDCRVCRRHSARYLRHLHRTGEILGSRLCTYHNLAFYARLMADIRAAITADSLLAFRAECRARWQRELR